MKAQNKKISSFLIIIATAILFSLSSIPDAIHEIGQVDASWLHRIERDLIESLRKEMWDLQLANSYLSQENRMLRRLAYTNKPKKWNTWLELLDYIKILNKKIKKQNRKIRILENKLRIRQNQIPSPYRQI